MSFEEKYKARKAIENYDVEAVANLLNEAGLPNCSSAIRKHHINGAALFTLKPSLLVLWKQDLDAQDSENLLELINYLKEFPELYYNKNLNDALYKNEDSDDDSFDNNENYYQNDDLDDDDRTSPNPQSTEEPAPPPLFPKAPQIKTATNFPTALPKVIPTLLQMPRSKMENNSKIISNTVQEILPAKNANDDDSLKFLQNKFGFPKEKANEFRDYLVGLEEKQALKNDQGNEVQVETKSSNFLENRKRIENAFNLAKSVEEHESYMIMNKDDAKTNLGKISNDYDVPKNTFPRPLDAVPKSIHTVYNDNDNYESPIRRASSMSIQKRQLPPTPNHTEFGAPPLEPPPRPYPNVIAEKFIKEEEIERNPNFFRISRREAKVKLKDQPNGRFLIRPSEKVSGYTLAIHFNKMDFNLKIRKRSDGKWALGEAKDGEVAFTKFSSMLKYYGPDIEELELCSPSIVYGKTHLNPFHRYS